jgi:hypothetical protein
MICVNCNSDIDNDSIHCDQCGKELFICLICNRTGKGKNCVHDGSKLQSLKQRQTEGVSVSTLMKAENHSTPIVTNGDNQIVSNATVIPILKIQNIKLNLDIEIKNDDIIGRTDGKFKHIFGQYLQVSGRHAKFNFDNVSGWQVTDFGSTNGTAVSDTINWQNSPKLKPGESTQLRNNSYLLIANIEFQIKILLPPTNTGTQRI